MFLLIEPTEIMKLLLKVRNVAFDERPENNNWPVKKCSGRRKPRGIIHVTVKGVHLVRAHKIRP